MAVFSSYIENFCPMQFLKQIQILVVKSAKYKIIIIIIIIIITTSTISIIIIIIIIIIIWS